MSASVRHYSRLSLFRRLFHDATGQAHPIADFLTNALGFSKDDAVSTSKKVSRLKSTQNPDSVIDLFERYGFEKAHLKTIVYRAPQILLLRPETNLEPKLGMLLEMGLSGSDLVQCLVKNPGILTKGLRTHITPVISLLREVLGCHENVVKCLTKTNWILTSSCAVKRLRPNVEVLRDCGLSDERIRKLLVRYPALFVLEPEHLRDAVSRVEEELHIPMESKIFFNGVSSLSCVSRSSLEMKFGIFKSFGWSDSDIYTMARTQPLCLAQSESKLRKVLNFFMMELCYTPAYLADRSMLLMLSLEKRVKPRMKVLKMLEENTTVNCNLAMVTVLKYSEKKFVEKCILCYKKELPNLNAGYADMLKE